RVAALTTSSVRGAGGGGLVTRAGVQLLGERSASRVLLGDQSQLGIQDHLLRLLGLQHTQVLAERALLHQDGRLHPDRLAVEGPLQGDRQEQPRRRRVLRNRGERRRQTDVALGCSKLCSESM